MNKKENDSGVAIDSSTLLDECQRIANNAIFFDDKSDYRSALLEICVTCGMDVDEIGIKYIEPNADFERSDGTLQDFVGGDLPAERG